MNKIAPRCCSFASAAFTAHVLSRLLLLVILLCASEAFADDEARRLVALLDYLGSDYKNAVQGGKVVNPDEYAEMQEFSKRSLEILEQLKAADKSDKAGIEPSLKSLAGQIDAKAAPETITELAQTAKQKLMTAYQIVPYPKQLPSLESGKSLYLENCAQCHGQTGKGDGPSRGTMNPKNPPPANFTDPDRMAGLSPFKAFNTATFGIEGTAMASFAALSDEQRWQVAFYVLSLRFSTDSANAGASVLQSKVVPPDLMTVASLATNSDEQLLEKLKNYAARESANTLLSALNATLGPFSSVWTQTELNDALSYLRLGIFENTSDPLVITRTLLREAAELYSRGEKENAYQKAVEAYLEGFELVEPTLFAKAGTLGRDIERELTEFRSAIKQAISAEEIKKRQLEIDSKLAQAAQRLAQEDSFSAYYAFVNSALIILREGLEAALIVAAILAMLRVTGAYQAIRYVHLGWILALAAGVLTWGASETILTMTGQHRESMEGFITVFAAVVLFYVGFWLHTRAEAKKWQAFIQNKIKDLLSKKKILALIGISFSAVYREAFEVVLFYQALWLQSESSHGAVIWGGLAGTAALVLATFAILKLGIRLPLKYFFQATGTLLYIMAFIFAGNGIKALQAAAWAPTTPLHFNIRVPMLGIYPTMETLAAQGVLLVLFLATTIWIARGQRKPA